MACVRRQKGSVLRLHWESSSRWGQDPGGVCLLTQLSSDRVERLERLAACWTGPISAVVLATGLRGGKCDGQADERKEAKASCAKGKAMLDVATAPLTVAVFTSVAAYYPVNALRNAALVRAAPYRFVAIVDVDLVPSAGLSQAIGSGSDLASRLCPLAAEAPGGAAVVVPTLEPVDGAGLSAIGCARGEFSVGDARRLLHAGTVRPMTWEQFPVGHRATDFSRWLSAPESSFSYGPVIYEEGFEPFVVMLREAVPPFDERFQGYGRNKCLFALHLAALGIEFHVLVGGCLLHDPHLPSDSYRRTFGDAKDAGRAAEVLRLYESTRREILESASMIYNEGQCQGDVSRQCRSSPWSAWSIGEVDGADDLQMCLLEMAMANRAAFSSGAPGSDLDAGVRLQSGTASDARITWSTHCSADRLWKLGRLLLRWEGPVCAAVLVARGEWATACRHAEAIIAEADAHGRHLTLWLSRFRWRFGRTPVYPANALRNRSLELVATDLALLADVDLEPSPGLLSALQARGPLERRSFLVVPAFEVFEGTSATFIRTATSFDDVKDHLGALFDSGGAMGFHQRHFPVGHGVTDFQRWFSSRESYGIGYEAGFEPYGVAWVKDLPCFDERFDAFFLGDKQAFFADLDAGDCEFSVMPDGCLFELDPHEPAARSAGRLVRVAARALMRRKLREVACRRLLKRLTGMNTLPCSCAKHVAPSPPFICDNAGLSRGPSRRPELDVPLGVWETRFNLDAATLRGFAAQGGGRLRQPFGASLVGCTGVESVVQDTMEPALTILLGDLFSESGGLLIRLEIGLWHALSLRYIVSLDAEALVGPVDGRLPGIRGEHASGAINTAFRWGPGGVGRYTVHAEQRGGQCSRPWGLVARQPHVLEQRLALEGGLLRVSAWVDGKQVYGASLSGAGVQLSDVVVAVYATSPGRGKVEIGDVVATASRCCEGGQVADAHVVGSNDADR